MHDHSWDGKQLTASMTGFTEYSTEQLKYPIKPTPTITPADVINELQKLKDSLRIDDFGQAVTLLMQHIDNKNNPHLTDLDQFTMSIADPKQTTTTTTTTTTKHI